MRLFLLVLLMVLPAFFAAAEIALLRLRPSRVEVLVEEGLRELQLFSACSDISNGL